jgi:hypothetical protein
MEDVSRPQIPAKGWAAAERVFDFSRHGMATSSPVRGA